MVASVNYLTLIGNVDLINSCIYSGLTDGDETVRVVLHVLFVSANSSVSKGSYTELPSLMLASCCDVETDVIKADCRSSNILFYINGS